ncbi:class I SAM-dependent methyltransferase [Pseudoalteromonas luteoviolacea]|uniref:Methyltransferase type 11 domain-containing protein n=1 Tax=Pseudoalteromonas luteoviolacea S4060-1 TaxID=1365257 RepID=A0A162CLV7_9GAMM|nr:class I SAM-dependent methyltransferase [Pseudoalteromonas luteoviolacea]KZN70563.1 hypothetical protein N478_01245 [Pseudoalteromonas luteoviolacea S4060-1]
MTNKLSNEMISLEQFFESISQETTHIINNIQYAPHHGVMVQSKSISESQQHTSDVYGHMWEQSQTIWDEESVKHNRKTLHREYPDAQSYIDKLDKEATVVDLGCGSGFSAHALFGEKLRDFNYYGVEISDAVYHAQQLMKEKYQNGHFLKADIATLPFAENQADFILCTGVLQHTDSVAASIESLAKLLKPGGISFVNCYKKPAPIRAFCDQYINGIVKNLPLDDINRTLDPLTQFGIELGKSDTKITVPADIPVLGIKQGEYPIQQFIFDFVFKAYYHANLSEANLAMMNYDWYSPQNCHQVSEEELTSLLIQNKLKILNVNETGTFISTIVTKE